MSSTNNLTQKIYRVLFIAAVLVSTGTISAISYADKSMQNQNRQGGGGGSNIDWGGLIGGILNNLTPRTPQYPPMYIPESPVDPSDTGSLFDDDPAGAGGTEGPRVRPVLPAQQEPTPTARPSTVDQLTNASGNRPEAMPGTPSGEPSTTPNLLNNTLGFPVIPPTTVPPGEYRKPHPDDPGGIRIVKVSEPDPATGKVTVTVTNITGGGSIETSQTGTVPTDKLDTLQKKLDSYTTRPVPTPPLVVSQPAQPVTQPPVSQPAQPVTQPQPVSQPIAKAQGDQPSTAQPIPPAIQAKVAKVRDLENQVKNKDFDRTSVTEMNNQDLPKASSTWGKRVVDPNDPAASLGGGKDAFPAENKFWGKADTQLPGLRDQLKQNASGSATEYNNLVTQKAKLEGLKTLEESKAANREAAGPHVTPSGHEVETSMGTAAKDLKTINEELGKVNSDLQKWTNPEGENNKQVRDGAIQQIQQASADKVKAADKAYTDAQTQAKAAKEDLVKSLTAPKAESGPKVAQPSSGK